MSRTVLFVDDDQLLLDGIKRRLRAEPYNVMTASTPKDALSILEENDISIIVADDQMPQMRGITLLNCVKDTFPNVIRILLTGKGDMHTAIRAINEAGVFRFLTKPCSEIELAVAIRRGLEQGSPDVSREQLAELVQMQASYIRHLETEYPGITKLNKDDSGAIIVEDNASSDLDLSTDIDE